jgi:hypothetical protein
MAAKPSGRGISGSAPARPDDDSRRVLAVLAVLAYRNG